MLYIRHKMWHYTIPSLMEGISCCMVTWSNKTKGIQSVNFWRFISLKEWTVSSAILVSVSLLAPCPLTSAVGNLESIHHNGLEVFWYVLVFGSGHWAVQLLPRVHLLLSPARSSHHFEHFLQVSDISTPWSHSPPSLSFPTRVVSVRQYSYSLLPGISQPHWEAHHGPQPW